MAQIAGSNSNRATAGVVNPSRQTSTSVAQRTQAGVQQKPNAALPVVTPPPIPMANPMGQIMAPAAPVQPVVSTPVAPVDNTPIMSLEDYLATDPTWQDYQAQQQSALAQNQASYITGVDQQNQGYQNNLNTLLQARGVAQEGQLEDYGSRGLGNSGFYGQARGLLDGQYAQQENTMGLDNTRALSSLEASKNQFTVDQANARNVQMQAAAARRAQAILAANGGATA